MQKWIILSLVIFGIILLVISYKVDKKTSFEDGSFLVQMVAIIAGILFIIVGIIWFLVLIFNGLL